MTLSKLVSWVEKNASTYNIQHFETELHNDLKGITDLRFFRTTMDCFGRTFGGYGSSSDPELALTKSIVECIERAAAIGQFGIRDSSGNACHFEPEYARQSSVLELIERDAFFSHFLSQTPFPELESSIRIQQTKNMIEKKSGKLNFFRMQSGKQNIYAVLCRLTWKFDAGEFYILSASAHENPEEAQIKALNENFSLTNNFLYHKDLPYSSESLTELAEKDKFGPGDHAKLFFSPDHSSWFYKTYFRDAKVLLPEINLPALKVQDYDFTGTMFEDCGLSLMVASSPETQVAYWGFPKKKLVNIGRLQLLKPNLKSEDVPWNRLHLFG